MKNTDSRKMEAIKMVASKVQNCKNNTCIFDTIDYVKASDAVELMLEFAQSRPATLKKVSDEEIKKFANDFDEGYSEKHGTDCTRSGFIAGVKWRESISEETKIRFNYVSDWVNSEIYSIENNLKNADNGTYAFDIFSDKLEQFKRLKSVISLFEQPEAIKSLKQ